MVGEISYEQVLAVAQQLKGSSGNLKQILETVNQKMSNIGKDGVWKSESAEQFKVKFRELSGKFELFYSAIENYSKFLNQTVETYKAADKAIAGKASEIL